MSWEDVGKVLAKALDKVIMSEDEGSCITQQLNKAWNRGAKSMYNRALIDIYDALQGKEESV